MKVSTAAASQVLLERGLAERNHSLISNSLNMLEKALGSGSREFDSQDLQGERVSLTDAWNSNLEWSEGGWRKTTATVLSKGVPKLVASGECNIELCKNCFWENICARESLNQTIAASRQLIADFKASDERHREMAEWRQKLEALKNEPIPNAAEELRRQREEFFAEKEFKRQKAIFYRDHSAAM